MFKVNNKDTRMTPQRYLQNRHKDMRHEALAKYNRRILRRN